MVQVNTILDRAYTTMRDDYNLDNLLEADESKFYEYLRGFLDNAIDTFDGSFGEIDYTFNDEMQVYVFNRDLTRKEQYILALGTAMMLYRKDLDDITQYKTHLTSKNFKEYSESTMMARRLERYNKMREEFEQEITKLQLNSLGNYFDSDSNKITMNQTTLNTYVKKNSDGSIEASWNGSDSSGFEWS